MGDPAGIGPEIIVKALSRPDIYQACRPVVIGDKTIMEKAIALTGIPLSIHLICHPDQYAYRQGSLHLIETSTLSPHAATLSHPTAETGQAMEGYILTAARLALEGAISAMVTAPITKTGLRMAGSAFHGHTELIASKTQTPNYAMMLAGDRLKVVLVTIHTPLAQVADALTPAEVARIIDLTHASLKSRFGIAAPRLAVAGLNPHAGEDGMFGTEEADRIAPAIAMAREKGVCVTGPLPPDTVFYHAVNGAFDAVICMYHDQGLIPFKLIHFEDGVNTTLGLPIIRTSVDHGTAYDIAWKAIANSASMICAIEMAARQAVNRRKTANAS
jgi:4-hydroxythreonine-4-phosphate dehydrogenase